MSAHAQTIPGYSLQETVVVPVTGSAVLSTTTLDLGVTYKIRATGTMQIAPDPLFADAEYARFSNPINNTVTGNVDLGIGINDSVNDNSKFPSWGAYDAGHVYVIDFSGLGAAIGLNFHDSFYPDNSGSLTVEIFAPAANAAWAAAFPIEQAPSIGPAPTPQILVGFNPMSEQPTVSLSNSFLAEINAAFGVDPVPFLQLNLATYSELAVPPTPILPTVLGNRLDFPLDDGQGTTATVRIEFSSTAGDMVDSAGLVAFEPLPAPPSSASIGFGSQPVGAGVSYQSLLVPMHSGSLGSGTNTLTMTVEILDDLGSPLPLVLASAELPLLGPWALGIFSAALAASGLVLAGRRR